MKLDKEIDLFKFSTMRTHSIGSRMYTPENNEELIQAINACNSDCYFLGGGSNIVFADRVEKPIINLMELNNSLTLNKDGTVTAGCSVRIQKLINFGKDNAMGGFEYLYSLPASVGGIVYMNAGRGRRHNQQISDYIESIEYLDINDMQVKTMLLNKELWTYRHSPFHKMKAVILTTTFKMQKSTTMDVTTRIQERKDIVRKTQEGNKPSCGSVFNKHNKYIMFLLRGKRIGGARYSQITNNWISNDMNGSADDVIKLVNYAKLLHKVLFQKCTLEIKIFK